jgi:Transposase DDE domain
MSLRETHQKRADGSVVTQLQLAESVWNPHKQRSAVRMVSKGGRAEAPQTAERLRKLARSILKKCAPHEIVAQDPQWRLLDTWPFGAFSVLEAIWKRLGIPEGIAAQRASRKIAFAIERALFAMVAHRACAPCSTLSGYEPWWREDVRIDGTDALALHHLSRAMDVLEAHQEAIEHALYCRLADFLTLDGELIFYATTSLHFDIDAGDQGHGEDDRVAGSPAAGSKTSKAPRKRGLSKNGRWDAPQSVIGLAVTRDGLPGRPGVFPGTTVDVNTVAQVKDDLRGWHLSRCVFVGDAGMVSQDNRKKLRASGGKYIVCRPRRRGDEVTNAVLQRPGRSQTVSDNLRVKAGVVGAGERRRRSVVWHNPDEETRQRAQRQQVLRARAAELASLHEGRGESHSKRGCQRRARRRYGRYLRLTKGGRRRIAATKRRAEEPLDGQFVVQSNDDSLTPADVALGDKPLQRVEEAGRTRKSGRRLRPVSHWAVHRMHAHVALRVLALLLERLIAQACGDTWRHIRADLNQIKLAPLLSPHGEVWQGTEPSPEAAKHLKCLESKHPPAVLHLT